MHLQQKNIYTWNQIHQEPTEKDFCVLKETGENVAWWFQPNNRFSLPLFVLLISVGLNGFDSSKPSEGVPTHGKQSCNYPCRLWRVCDFVALFNNRPLICSLTQFSSAVCLFSPFHRCHTAVSCLQCYIREWHVLVMWPGKVTQKKSYFTTVPSRLSYVYCYNCLILK